MSLIRGDDPVARLCGRMFRRVRRQCDGAPKSLSAIGSDAACATPRTAGNCSAGKIVDAPVNIQGRVRNICARNKNGIFGKGEPRLVFGEIAAGADGAGSISAILGSRHGCKTWRCIHDAARQRHLCDRIGR